MAAKSQNLIANTGTKKKTLLVSKDNLIKCWSDMEIFLNRQTLLAEVLKDGTVDYPKDPNNHELWDDDHVKMPFSLKNSLTDKENGKDILIWNIIKDSLKSEIKSLNDFEIKIDSYKVSKSPNQRNFQSLKNFFLSLTDNEEEKVIQNLQIMSKLALRVKKYIQKPIPLLKINMNSSITFSQEQIASLLASAFYCMFPIDKNKKDNFPSINFTSLFRQSDQKDNKIEKFLCLFNYFRRISIEEPRKENLVTFERKCLKTEDYPHWKKSKKKIGNFSCIKDENIDDGGFLMMQVDFANKFIGGLIFGNSYFQEEIKFLICPELIISRLFTEKLENNECLIITGYERFSDYSGYGEKFKFTQPYQDKTPIDSKTKHRRSRLVAIDALPYRSPHSQYKSSNINRELNKAYCGFETSKESNPIPVATGNWGCGAFGGDVKLKSLIQLMAASESERDLVYFTFGNEDLTNKLLEIYKCLQNAQITVGKLYKIIKSFDPKIENDLFAYVKKTILQPKTDLTKENVCLYDGYIIKMPSTNEQGQIYDSLNNWNVNFLEENIQNKDEKNVSINIGSKVQYKLKSKSDNQAEVVIVSKNSNIIKDTTPSTQQLQNPINNESIYSSWNYIGLCVHKNNCYRKNPEHLRDFNHPKLTEALKNPHLIKNLDENGKIQLDLLKKAIDTANMDIYNDRLERYDKSMAYQNSNGTQRTVCRYGNRCYRKGEEHLLMFKHPKVEEALNSKKIFDSLNDDEKERCRILNNALKKQQMRS